MSTVTIQVSPLKIALVVAGIAGLILGGIAQLICMFNPPIDLSFIKFLMLGSRGLRLADLQPFVYFWFGIGTFLILVGLFAKLLPDAEQTAKQVAYRRKLIDSLNSETQNPTVTPSGQTRPKTKLNTFTVLFIISIVVIPFVIMTLNF
jgi:hypothetical protein